MENIEQLSAFYKYRGFSGRLVDGFSFFAKNFKTIFTTSAFILIPFVFLLAVVVGVFFPLGNLGMLSAGAAATTGASLWVPQAVFLLLVLICTSVWGAVLFAMYRKYIELGYVPTWKTGVWLGYMKRDIWRFFLFVLFLAFFWGILSSVITIVAIHWVWIWLVCLPVLVYLDVVFSLIPYYYMIDRMTLWDSILHAFRKGTRSWGTTFSILLFANIVAGFLLFVSSLPCILTIVVDVVASQSLASGGEAALPSYYVVLRIICYALCFYGSFLCYLFTTGALLFQYASISAHDKEKQLAEARAEEERARLAREREEIARKKEEARKDGSAYRPW